MRANQRLGEYELTDVLGRGAFGTVWEARHLTLNRHSAIKILGDGQIDAGQNDRLVREARIAAGLRHPNIVRVLEIGTDDHGPKHRSYVVYELIEGVTLAEWSEFSSLSFREIAGLTSKLAAALHFAHERGIVHRDLKPENILVDLSGEPRITDFGLARAVDDRVTEHNVTLGTVAYMSPEQARGESGDADARSDVFSLGVILFEMLTGQLPFSGKTIPSYLAQVSGLAPTSPRAIDLSIPRDLETICLKCLSQKPEERYPTAGELADDLDRFSEGRPIRARPAGPIEKIVRWCLRQPVAATLVSLLILLAIVGPMIAIYQSGMRQTLQIRTDSLRETNYATDLQLAFKAWNDGYLRQTRSILDRASQDEDGKRLRDFAWHFLNDRVNESYQVIAKSDSPIFASTLTDDGKYLLTVGASNQISIWNPTNGVLERSISLPHSEYFAIAEIPETNTIIVGDNQTGQSQLRFLDFRTGKQTGAVSLPTEKTVESIQLSPNGKSFLVGTRYDAVRQFNTSGQLLREFPNHSRNEAVTYSVRYKSTLIVAAEQLGEGAEDRIRVFNPISGKVWATASLSYKPVGMAWAQPGLFMAVLGDNRSEIELFRSKHPKLEKINTLWAPTRRNTLAVFFPDARSLALAGDDGRVTVKSVAFASGGYDNATYSPHDAAVRSLSYLPGGRLMTASEDGTAVISRPAQVAAAGARVRTRVMNHSVMEFSRPLNRLFVGDGDGYLRDGEGNVLTKLDAGISSVAFAPDGNSIVCGMLDGRIVFLDASNYTVRRDIVPTTAASTSAKVESIAFTEDGRLMICGTADSLVRLWSLADSTPVFEEQLTNSSTSIVVHDEIGLVICSGIYEQIHAFDLKGHRRFRFDAGGSRSMLLHPEQPTLISAHEDGVVRIWDLETRQQRGILRGHQREVISLALHPDGNTLATGSDDGTVRLWNVKRQQEIGIMLSEDAMLSARSLAFSRNGDLLFALAEGERTKKIVELGTTADVFLGYDVSPQQMDYRDNVTCEVVREGGHESLSVERKSRTANSKVGAWLSERCKGHEVRAHFKFDLKRGRAAALIDHYYSIGFYRHRPDPWLGRSKEFKPGDNLEASTDWVRITDGPWEPKRDEEKKPYGAVLLLSKDAIVDIQSLRIEARPLSR